MAVKRPAIICDIDGTLANCEHRRHFLMGGGKPDWRSFNESMVADTVNQWCLELIIGMYEYGFDILLVSGRSEDCRQHTLDWLRTHWPYNLPVLPKLFMRPSKDYRKDCIVKEEIYRTQIEPNYQIAFCIDDRQQVVDMWRSLGLVCLQCDVGDF